MCRRKSYFAKLYMQNLGAYRRLGLTYRERYELCANVNHSAKIIMQSLGVYRPLGLTYRNRHAPGGRVDHTIQTCVCKASGTAGPLASLIASGMNHAHS